MKAVLSVQQRKKSVQNEMGFGGKGGFEVVNVEVDDSEN